MASKRPFKRKSGFRDSKLYIIACEGSKTELEYFERVIGSKNFRSYRIHIELLRRNTTNSAPEYVVEELDNFYKEYNLSSNDELWAIIDYDRWGIKKISNIAQKTGQKGYNIALSNPCFEVWKLLHFVDIENYSKEQKQNLSKSCKNVKNELANIHRNINNPTEDLSAFSIKQIDFAVQQATKLDAGARWPNSFGTDVYKLFDSISKSL